MNHWMECIAILEGAFLGQGDSA